MLNKSPYRYIGKSAAVAAGILYIISMPVFASGFALNEQSVTYTGNAYAGTSSATQDASTSYYNPAGLGELRYSQLVLGAAYLKPKIKLFNAVATDRAGNPLTGNNPTEPKGRMLIPNGHVAWRVSQDFSLGFSVVEPFGMNTIYGNQDMARLMATRTRIRTLDLSPTFGYKVNKSLSIGAGLDFLRMSTNIASIVGTTGGGGSEGSAYVINKGSGRAIGYHVGILYKPNICTKMGLVYFSGFSPSISGTTWSSGTINFSTTSRFSSKFKLPDRINYSTTYNFARNWLAMGEVEWTHWSRLKRVLMDYNSSALPGYQNLYYKNTWRAAVGTDYKLSRTWTFKGGLGYDQSPVNKSYRSARLPDSDRYLVGVGAKYTFYKYFSINAAYSRIFCENFNINQTAASDGLNPSAAVTDRRTLRGKFKNAYNIFGLQLNYDFAQLQ